MIQEVKVGENIVVLDSEKLYSGLANPDDSEKLIRKAIGLPVKKQLVYYSDKNDINAILNVSVYQLVEMYDITERWYTIEITLETEEKIRIHSGYLIEMQKPSFVADMAALR